MEKNSRRGGEKVAGSTSPLIKGKRGREREWPVHLVLSLQSQSVELKKPVLYLPAVEAYASDIALTLCPLYVTISFSLCFHRNFTATLVLNSS